MDNLPMLMPEELKDIYDRVEKVLSSVEMNENSIKLYHNLRNAVLEMLSIEPGRLEHMGLEDEIVMFMGYEKREIEDDRAPDEVLEEYDKRVKPRQQWTRQPI